jgi:RimJ/RimL family protein N-acetyltransferase
MGFVANLELHPQVHYRWRHRGVTPSPDRLISTLWEGALVIFMVAARETGRPIGLVVGYGADHRNGVCHVGLVADPNQPPGPPLIFDGFALLLDYLFRVWPFRKVFAEVPGFNVEQFGSMIGRLFVEEGRLREYEFYNGQYWDKIWLGLSRSEWVAARLRLLSPVVDMPLEL